MVMYGILYLSTKERSDFMKLSNYTVEGCHQEELFESAKGTEDIYDIEEEEVIEGESKSDAFKRITGPRINKIVDELRKLANASNTRRYEYSQEDVDKIFEYIEAATNKAKSMYTKEKVFMPEFRW